MGWREKKMSSKRKDHLFGRHLGDNGVYFPGDFATHAQIFRIKRPGIFIIVRAVPFLERFGTIIFCPSRLYTALFTAFICS